MIQKGEFALPVNCISHQDCGCHLNIVNTQTSDCTHWDAIQLTKGSTVYIVYRLSTYVTNLSEHCDLILTPTGDSSIMTVATKSKSIAGAVCKLGFCTET